MRSHIEPQLQVRSSRYLIECELITLKHATNILDFNFQYADYSTTKCGIETLSNEYERIKDGRMENMAIKYDSQVVGGQVGGFWGKLRDPQAEWEVKKQS